VALRSVDRREDQMLGMPTTYEFVQFMPDKSKIIIEEKDSTKNKHKSINSESYTIGNGSIKINTTINKVETATTPIIINSTMNKEVNANKTINNSTTIKEKTSVTINYVFNATTRTTESTKYNHNIITEGYKQSNIKTSTETNLNDNNTSGVWK